MNPVSQIMNPLLEESDSYKNKKTTTLEFPSAKSSKGEESKERVSIDEYQEEPSNFSYQEEFFFDAGERRIVSVSIVLKSNALYINLMENDEKRKKKHRFFLLNIDSRKLVYKSKRFGWGFCRFSQKKDQIFQR